MAGCSPEGEPGLRPAPHPAGATPKEPGGASERPDPPSAPPSAPPCCSLHWAPGKGSWVHTQQGDGTPPAVGWPTPAIAVEGGRLQMFLTLNKMNKRKW